MTKTGVYNVNLRVQCHDYMILKVQSFEGFHTKTIDCSEKTHSETFVTKMSSLVSKVNFVTDYAQLASEIIQPIEQGEITDDSDYLKRTGFNQAVSTGLSKKSYDEEIIYHLKKKTKEASFNMMEVRFQKSEMIVFDNCDEMKYFFYLVLGYPYYMFQSLTSFITE